MKTKKLILSAFLLAGTTATLCAQESVVNIFKSGAADLNTVANGYLKPFGNSFSTGLGSNWYNTADVHGVLGFDLTFGMTGVMTPKSDQTFDLSGLKNLQPDNGVTTAPTFAGSGSGVPLTLYQPDKLSNGSANPLAGDKILSFTTPKGISKVMPVPSLQLTVGLPVVNDVSLRLTPKVKTADYELSMWGVGIKHNFKRWIPGLKLLPFDAAALVAYSQFNVQYNIPKGSVITPDKLVDNSSLTTEYDNNATPYYGQNMHLKAKAFTAAVIVSKKLLFITPYVGVGMTKTNFDIAMAGTYPILSEVKMNSNGTPATQNGKAVMKYENITDPIKVSDGLTMMNATFGLRMKILAVLSLHAQYVLQKYPTASVGLGVSIR